MSAPEVLVLVAHSAGGPALPLFVELVQTPAGTWTICMRGKLGEILTQPQETREAAISAAMGFRS